MCLVAPSTTSPALREGGGGFIHRVNSSYRFGVLFLDVRGDPGLKVRWLEEDFRRGVRA
jgi:hypothetical protein